MALFKKTDCCLCGQKAGLLTRQKIADDNYICADCRLLCSQDISGRRWRTLTLEDVQAHMEELENDQTLIADEFRETDAVTKRGFTGETLLCVDGENGWWYVPDRNKPDVFSFEHVMDYRLELDTSLLDEEERKEQREREEHFEPPRGRRRDDEEEGGLLDFLDDLFSVSLRASRLPRCPRGEKITGMHMVITLHHPYVDEVKIDVLNAIFPDQRDIRIGYEAARDMVDLFDHYSEEFDFAYDLTEEEEEEEV